MTPEREALALDYDPWGERDATYRTLDDRFVTTRKPADCAICFEPIPAGSRVRAKREVDEGRAKTFRFCVECCRLMAHRIDEPVEDGPDNFDLLMRRYDIGRQNAEAARKESAHE